MLRTENYKIDMSTKTVKSRDSDCVLLNVVNSSSEKKISGNEYVGRNSAGNAIILRNATKWYKSGDLVLDGLDMTVPCGSTYGLLGSSGCGKTTVLSCIAGQRKLNGGYIRVFGEKPGSKVTGIPGKNIGYMPQDIALYMEFSISETLTYFGTLNGMSSDKIEERKRMLIKLLDLPAETRKIETLSGGQQRRCSFSVALIHEPALLILDEPTVGVDPVLRQKLWLHLRELVSQKRTTVIITTHYIEESRQADCIGIMRDGRLLIEQRPNEIFAQHGTTDLEKIVLRLCKINSPTFQATISRRRNADNLIALDLTESAGALKTEQNKWEFRMASIKNVANPTKFDPLTRVRALTQKNFVVLLRNPLLFFFVLFIPSVLFLIESISMGFSPKGLNMGIVNHEADCSYIPRILPGCSISLFSCKILANISKDIVHWKLYEHEDDAMQATKQGHIWGYVRFHSNFSSMLNERLASGPENDDVYNLSIITVRLDETSKLISSKVKQVLYAAYENFIKTHLHECGQDSRLADYTLQYRQPIFGKTDDNPLEFLAPSVISPLMFFFPIITTSIRLIKERKKGVLQRSIIGGVQKLEIFISYCISEFSVFLCQSIFNYSVLTLYFKIEILGSDLLFIFVLILSGFVGVSMGFLLGSVFPEEIQAALLAMAIFFPSSVLSGSMWPIEGMVPWLRSFSQVLPCTLLGESVRSITSRGWEFTHPNVWPGILVMGAYIPGFLLLTVLIHLVIKK